MSTQRNENKLRLWPGLIVVALQSLLRFVLPLIIPEAMAFAVFAGLAGAVALLVWWLFFSRAAALERWGAAVLMAAALVAASFAIDDSIATANMGLMFPMYALPVMCLALVLWAGATRGLGASARRLTLVAAVLAASGGWILLRTDGMDGSGHHELAWRWAETHEERLLEQSGTDVAAGPTSESSLETAPAGSAEWPGFRGPERSGVVRGVKLRTDWAADPPEQLWRRPVGPGCSSFAVRGGLLYTQEQRGEYEVVSCYQLASGQPVWKHRDPVRFYDSHAGAGPRSTPTLAGGRVYTLGATGILNVLDARDGTVIWSRDASSDAEVEILPWGFTSSPLVYQDTVIVALSGKLAAYAAESGEPRWYGPEGGPSYSSPHLVEIEGVSQVLLMSESGAISVQPEDGRELWRSDWLTDDRILQPAQIPGGDLLLSADGFKGLRRIRVRNRGGEWAVEELWTSTEMRLNFNDFVVHKGHAYGFDGPSIACIDIREGTRRWKGERYSGWILLLADQDLLLVLTEKGELALVPADSSAFRELARMQAIEGKTWNHPVLVNDIVVVRNAREMAAFRLPW